MDEWATVNRKHHDNPPDIDKFMDSYGDFAPISRNLEEVRITGKDFMTQACRMKNSSLGFDGWTVVAVKLLPLDVWNHRAEVEELALKLGRVPKVNEHAQNVVLPKAEGDTELKHRCITIFSVLRRVLAGASWNKLQQ